MQENLQLCESRILNKSGDYTYSTCSTIANDYFFMGGHKKVFGVIYIAYNKINKKIYVGQTQKSFFNRQNQHLKNKTSNHFYNALRKDRDNFIWKVICIAYSQQELNNQEKFYIDIYGITDPKFGYNIAPGGQGGVTVYGPRHSEEQKKKWSKERKGKKGHPASQKHIDKMKSNNPASRPEVRKKISDGRRKAIEEGRVNLTEDGRKRLATSKGKIWIYKFENENYISKYILKKESLFWIKQGWIKGRTPLVKYKMKNSNKNTIWITNKIKNKRIGLEDEKLFLENGWIRGCTKCLK